MIVPFKEMFFDVILPLLCGTIIGLVLVFGVVSISSYATRTDSPCDIRQATVACVDGRLNVRLKDGYYAELIDDELQPIICQFGQEE
jgi:hypothetical protein